MDNRTVRKMILGLTQLEARRLGVGRSTLHNLKENAKKSGSFQIYARVREKLYPHVT